MLREWVEKRIGEAKMMVDLGIIDEKFEPYEFYCSQNRDKSFSCGLTRSWNPFLEAYVTNDINLTLEQIECVIGNREIDVNQLAMELNLISDHSSFNERISEKLMKNVN